MFVCSALAAWELSGRIWPSAPFFIGSPSGVVKALGQTLADPAMLRHASSSVKNLLAGYILAVLAAVSLGLPSGYFKRVYSNIRVYVQVFYSVPRLVFIPLFILWLGIDDAAKIGIVFLMTFFTVYIAALEAAKRIDRELSDVCRVYGAGRLLTLTSLVLPAAAGPVLTGAKLAVGRAVAGMLLSETFGRPEGLGYLLFHYGATYMVNRMLAVLALVMALSVAMFYAVELLEYKLIKWQA